MLRPPKTNDPALNRFLEEVASTIQDRVRPEEGWTLSDFASSVSEVISDKRDLIDIVTKYDSIEGLSEEMEAATAILKSEIQDSINLLSSIESKSAEFGEVMEWWDQNYKVIFDAQEAMEIFGEISAALEGHQDILDQIAAATAVAEDVVTEVRAAEDSAKAAEAAAKTSETNAADAAAAAKASETAAGESATSAGASATAAAGDAATAAGARDGAVSAADAAQSSATTAAADADRTEVAAAGVDQVVSDAVGVLSGEIADGMAAAQAARAGAESARDEAAGSATLASAKADEAAASATLADGRATDAESAVASIAAHATDAEDAAGRAAVSESNAAASESNAADSAATAQGHADRAATEAGAAAQIAAAEKIAEQVGSAPADLDTIYELAAAFEARGDAIAAIQDALANRVVGNHSSVISATVPGVGTPTNQITFVVEGV